MGNSLGSQLSARGLRVMQETGNVHGIQLSSDLLGTQVNIGIIHRVRRQLSFLLYLVIQIRFRGNVLGIQLSSDLLVPQDNGGIMPRGRRQLSFLLHLTIQRRFRGNVLGIQLSLGLIVTQDNVGNMRFFARNFDIQLRFRELFNNNLQAHIPEELSGFGQSL